MEFLENKTGESTAWAYLLSTAEIVKYCSQNWDWCSTNF